TWSSPSICRTWDCACAKSWAIPPPSLSPPEFARDLFFRDILLLTTMSDYPKGSPWGPHGPQVSGPPTTTPNPTAAWSEPSTDGQGSANQPANSGGSSFVIDWLFRPPK